jgi:hypothetical protein
VTTAEQNRPVLARPTGSAPCDRIESRLFEFLVQHVQNTENPGKSQDLKHMYVAYGLAVARHAFVINSDPENEQQEELFKEIARQAPGLYVSDVATAIRLLSQRMRDKLLIYGNGTPEGRLAQQVILEGGNP